MERAVKLNYFLGGALLATLFGQGCGPGGSTPFDAWAQDASANQPVPVMICDGENQSGLCAAVVKPTDTSRNILVTL